MKRGVKTIQIVGILAVILLLIVIINTNKNNLQKSNPKLIMPSLTPVTSSIPPSPSLKPSPKPSPKPFISCVKSSEITECNLLKFPVKFSYSNNLKMDYHDRDLDKIGETSYPSVVNIINGDKLIMTIYPKMEGTDAPLTPTRPFLVDGKQLEIGPNKVEKIATLENRGYYMFLQYPKNPSPWLWINCLAQDESSSKTCDNIVKSIEFTQD